MINAGFLLDQKYAIISIPLPIVFWNTLEGNNILGESPFGEGTPCPLLAESQNK